MKKLITTSLVLALSAMSLTATAGPENYFKSFDKNADGSLDKAEYKKLLAPGFKSRGKELTDERVENNFRRLNTNGDAVISLEEFLAGKKKK